jgi:hypothetical protein
LHTAYSIHAPGAYYGDIYNIPDEMGKFDVVFLGMVLPHCESRSTPSRRPRA